MHKQWVSLENASLWLIGLANHDSDAELVKALADVQPELLTSVVTHVNKNGGTLLHVTAVRERTEALGVLLKNTVDIDTRDGEGYSPLYACISHNSMAAANMLVQAGADVSEIVCRLSGETMLHKMVKAGRGKIVEFLLQSGSAVDAATRKGDTALHFAARYNRSNMADILLDGGSDVNAVNESGETAIHVAINNMNMDLAKLLIRRKANLTIKDKQGRTSLHVAVASGCLELVKLMLSSNSSHINSKESLLGRTPLLLACSNGTHKMAALLLTHGADANLTTNYRKSVLHVAAATGNAKVLGTVIKFTSNLNALAINNMTALHYAICGGHTEIVKLLLRCGSSSNMKDIHGASPLHMACSTGHTEIASSLLQYDAQIDSTNMEQQTALHLALMNGYHDIGQLLVSAGSDVNLLDIHDKKASDYFEYFCEAQAEQSGDSVKIADKSLSSQDGEERLHVRFSATEDENEVFLSDEDESPSVFDNADHTASLQSSQISKSKESENISQNKSKNKHKFTTPILERKIEEELVSTAGKVAINEKETEFECESNSGVKINSEAETCETKGTKLKRRNSSYNKGHKSTKDKKGAGTRRHSKSKAKGHRHSSKEEKEHGGENNDMHECRRKHNVELEVSTLLSSTD